MSVKVGDGTITLEGRCGVEEAEKVLAALLAHPGVTVVLKAEQVHTAIWQVLLAARPPLDGHPPTEFSRMFVLPLIEPPLAGKC